MKHELLTDELRAWLRRHQRPSLLRFLFDVTLTWTVIAAAIAFALAVDAWWASLIAMVVVGTRQHALGALVHDGTHFTLAKNKALNDFLCDVLCAFPIFISTRGFRVFHVTHHQYTRTERDPEVHAKDAHVDYAWPKSKRATAWVLGRDILGVNALAVVQNLVIWSDLPSLLRLSEAELLKLKVVPGFAKFLDRTDAKFRLPIHIKARVVAFYFALVVVVTTFGLWPMFLLYWIVPLLTVLAFLTRIRGMSEHNGLPWENPLNASRTTLWPNRLLRMVMTPFNVNHHLEHHLFPQVPYFQLDELHRELMKQRMFRANAAVATNYFANLVVPALHPSESDSAAGDGAPARRPEAVAPACVDGERRVNVSFAVMPSTSTAKAE